MSLQLKYNKILYKLFTVMTILMIILMIIIIIKVASKLSTESIQKLPILTNNYFNNK